MRWNHSSALYAFDQLADPAQLPGICGNDLIGVFGHLVLEESQKAEHHRVAILARGTTAPTGLGREQRLPIGQHGDLYCAAELRMRLEKTGIYKHTVEVTDVSDLAGLLL
jgi:hypothetical protein